MMIPKSPMDPKLIPTSYYDLNKLFPRYYLQKELQFSKNLWFARSCVVTGLVAVFAKFMMTINNVKVHNKEKLHSILSDCQSKRLPLVTLSNHHACLDDPLLFGILQWRHLLSQNFMRWSLAAHDVCFTRGFHSKLFSLGKIVPVVRGEGVYQPGMNFCLERLKLGEWVHIFPEGKVNLTKEPRRLKWGIGRLILDCQPSIPTILPIYHIGMDDVLPNKRPYILRANSNVTINIGDPIKVDDFLIPRPNSSTESRRKLLTDFIQEKLHNLGTETKKLHLNNYR